MPKKILTIIISILILTSHFDATLHLQAYEEVVDALTALRRIEEELEKGRIPSGSITEANFVIPEGFPVELAKKLWLFVAQLISTGCSENEIRRAIIDVNDTLRLPARISYELKNYTIIPKYDEARVIRSNDGSISVEIPYRAIYGLGKDVDVGSVKYESSEANLLHVLRRYPKRRTYLVRAIDPDAYTFTFIDLNTGKIFNKTAKVNIGLFSNLSQNCFGFESFIVAVPGHFEERREAVKSQVSEFRVLLPAHDPLVVDTSISPTRVKVGDVITVSAQIRNPQEAKGFRILLGASFSHKDAFEAWASPPIGFSYVLGCPASYLYLRAKRSGVYQITIYFAVVEPKNLDVVFWNGEKTVTYVVTVLPEAPKLRVVVEARALAKFANLTITLVNSGGQEARDVKLFVTGDVEEKELDVGGVWHTWEGNIITKLLSPIAKVNVTAVYHDLDGKRHTSTSLMTISTTNFVTPEEWRTYLIEVPEYEETKRVFVPGYQGAMHVKLYLIRNCLAPPSTGFLNGLSLIPISPNGFTLTLENASDIMEISSRAPEVRYMLLDVKPGFLCERVLREDEVKKLFHINEDERLEPSKISPSYEVRLLKEEVLNQSEIVTVNDEFYEKLQYSNWEDHDYKYEDTGVKKWDLDKAIAKVSHGKTLELVYRPLACQGDLVKGVLVKNYAARDMAYELEILQGPIAEAPPGNSVLNIQSYGSIPLNIVQLESMNYPIFIRLKYQGRIVASLWIHTGGRVSEFWSGFWDGVKEKLPGIIVTATIMVILAIPTHGGSLLAYVKDLMASAVIPSLLAVGVASNIREILEAYSAYKKMDEVAEELDGFSQRAAYSGYFNTYSFFQGLRSKIRENQGLVVGSTALDLLADVTIRDLLVTFGREDAREYEKGKALGRLVGAALSLATYVGIYYKFLSNGPKLLSRAGQIKEILKGTYNWITPPLWDLGVIAGKLTAKGIAATLAFSEQDQKFKDCLNRIKGDSLIGLGESTEKYLDDALDTSSGHGLSEDAYMGLLKVYESVAKDFSAKQWEDFLSKIEDISGSNKKFADEFLRWAYQVDDDLLRRVVAEITPKLAKLEPDELERIGDKIGGIVEKYLEIEVSSGKKAADEFLNKMLKDPSTLDEFLGTKIDFGTNPHRVKLNEDGGALWLGSNNKVQGAHRVKVHWQCGSGADKKSGKMEFWHTSKTETNQIRIPTEQAKEALNQIGKDEAEIFVTEIELRDFRLSFPKMFSVGDASFKSDFYDKLEINGKTYKINNLNPYVHEGKLHIDVELEGKNLRSKNLVLSFCDDGKVMIGYEDEHFSINEIEINEDPNLMKITYDSYGKKMTTEYSFNLKSLDDQLKITHSFNYEESVQGKNVLGLKERLFRILGSNALEELKNRIESTDEGSRVAILVHFDNGKIAYCGNEQLEVRIPLRAERITKLEIILFKELSNLKRSAIKVLEKPQDTNLKGELGQAIANEMYMDKVLSELSEKAGVPKDKMEAIYRGGKGKPDFEIIITETATTASGEIFSEGTRIAVVEVKFVGDPEDVEGFRDKIGEARKQIIDNRFKDPKWTVPYGVIFVISWPAEQIVKNVPHPPKVGDFNNPYIEIKERE